MFHPADIKPSGVDCTRNRVRFFGAVPDLGAVCGFGGDGGTSGKTRSFACHGPEGCAKLDYKADNCKEVSAFVDL
ncbi:uncharacterized protein PG986_005756 [Apiospora aurea]|uniref:Uncharacterized protein n=1 Tax=Apiospora aurea TaxID=335848 RepID=A0ABR1QIU8_9PEZI